MSQTSIESLRDKISRILSDNETLSKENRDLKARLTETQQALDNQNINVEQLKTRIERLQLEKAFDGATADKAETKRRISQMIRQIDRCIALVEE